MQDPLERDARLFRDGTHRVRWAVELAEDDLVLAEEDRAEVADAEPRRRLRDAAVERLEVRVVDVGPEALGDEALFHPCRR